MLVYILYIFYLCKFWYCAIIHAVFTNMNIWVPRIQIGSIIMDSIFYISLGPVIMNTGTKDTI